MRWRETIDHIIAHRLESAADTIEKRYRDLQGESADGRKLRGRRERHQLRDQVAEQHHDGEDQNADQPLRNPPCKGAFPEKEKTQYDQKPVDKPDTQQQHIQNAARIFGEKLYEIL